MEDKFLMENVLYGSKVINDLYMHGIIESSTDKVKLLFNKIIQETLKMHNEIYKAMENAGFYTATQVDEKKISQTREKLVCVCEECNCEED